jgi:hypothetical protein
MKTAFSLFLREYINPKHIDYTDCGTFQIVCAVCKEPVFKVSRGIEGKTTDYFSHYRRDETLNKQCELRVNHISEKRFEEARSESRDQNLHLFLQVFQDIIWENEYNKTTRKKAKQQFFQLSRSQVLSTFFRLILQRFRNEIEDKNEIFDMFDESLENIYDESTGFTSNYATALQKEFAFDFLHHLLAGHSKANFFFLLNHAFILVLEKLEGKKKNGESVPWEEAMFEYLNKFLKTQNEKKRMSIMNKMGEFEMISPYTRQEIDLYIMFGSYLHYNAFGILLRIPYLQLLKQALSIRKPV